MTELEKMGKLVVALRQLDKVMRPGRRHDKLVAAFRQTWICEHEYHQKVDALYPRDGKFICVDKVQFRNVPAPQEVKQAPSKLREACSLWNYREETPPPAWSQAKRREVTKESARIRKRARQTIRAAGGVVG